MADTPGTLVFESAFTVDATIDRLDALARSKGLTIFARIDFARDAHIAGLALQPEQLLLFGNPAAGTPLLQAVPGVGLDLPLKALAYADAAGRTWVVINDPDYVIARHAVPAALKANIQGMVALVQAAAGHPARNKGKQP